MFSELFEYDTASVPVEQRAQMAGILKARADILHAAADVSALRARVWRGDESLKDITDLKAADLTKLRQDYGKQAVEFLKGAVNIQELKETAPMIALALLQTLNIPLPMVLEALGVDVDQIKLLVSQIKELVEKD